MSWFILQITLDEIRNANVFNTDNANGSVEAVDPSKQGMMDPRLSLYGYTNETVNMLLVPMFKNR